MDKNDWNQLVSEGLASFKKIRIIRNDDSEEQYILYGMLIDIPDKPAYPSGEIIPGQEPNFTVTEEKGSAPKKIYLSDIKEIKIIEE